MHLGIAWQTHMAAGKDGTRVTARSKGKMERPFSTVKEAHETLYHFHKPETEAQANTWLLRYLMRYNDQQHRSPSHSRQADWLTNLPGEGLREMCTWEQFCRFAREPVQRKVGVDARVMVEGTAYEVDPQLAGEVVLPWWGLFDDALYVEYEADSADSCLGRERLAVAALNRPAGAPQATLRCGRPGVSFPHTHGGEARPCRGLGPAIGQAYPGRPSVHRPGLGGNADASPRPEASP